MAFAEYLFLVEPGLKALVNLGRNLKEAKADDGKIDISEFWGAIAKMGLEMLPSAETLIRTEEEERKRKEEEKKKKPPPTPGTPV